MKAELTIVGWPFTVELRVEEGRSRIILTAVRPNTPPEALEVAIWSLHQNLEAVKRNMAEWEANWR